MNLIEMASTAPTRPVWTAPALAGGPVLASGILSQIGNTPLLDLNAFAHRCGMPASVGMYAKAEWLNPGGSVKSRAALRIVKEALRSGDLVTGKTLIDSSSGNTGIAYALIGSALGFSVHLVMPGNVSTERKTLARAYGAKIIESDPLEGSDGAIRMVRDLVAANPDRYFYADQYNNPANWQAHFDTTGPEIWRQTRSSVTHFVTGLGTSGTFVGVGRYLKRQCEDIQLIALQPEDELNTIEGLKHMETAIVPGIFDESLVDRYEFVSAELSLALTRRLARETGLFVGLSAGAAVEGAIRIARGIESGVVVTLLPDDGSKYLSLGVFD